VRGQRGETSCLKSQSRGEQSQGGNSSGLLPSPRQADSGFKVSLGDIVSPSILLLVGVSFVAFRSQLLLARGKGDASSTKFEAQARVAEGNVPSHVWSLGFLESSCS
jgi:hypothetical protein